MSTLANDMYEHLARTGAKVQVEDQMARYMTSRKRVWEALNELIAAGKVVKTKVKKLTVYFCPDAKPQDTHQPLQFKPYQPPKVLTDLRRDLEAHRERFPSKHI